MGPVLYELNEGIATLALNLPSKLNPVALDLQQALRECFARVRGDSQVRAVLLTGAGKAFCVGADLSAMRPPERPDPGRPDRRLDADHEQPPDPGAPRAPVPVVCAVNGPAAGAGIGLALACDIVVAAQRLLLPAFPAQARHRSRPRLHLVRSAAGRPGAGDGHGAARREANAETAAQWGLIWAAIDDGPLLLER